MQPPERSFLYQVTGRNASRVVGLGIFHCASETVAFLPQGTLTRRETYFLGKGPRGAVCPAQRSMVAGDAPSHSSRLPAEVTENAH